MRVLGTAEEINSELLRHLATCTSCRIAVAWASAGFPAFDRQVESRRTVERMVVGTHFNQTHPEFMAAFLDAHLYDTKEMLTQNEPTAGLGWSSYSDPVFYKSSAAVPAWCSVGLLPSRRPCPLAARGDDHSICPELPHHAV